MTVWHGANTLQDKQIFFLFNTVLCITSHQRAVGSHCADLTSISIHRVRLLSFLRSGTSETDLYTQLSAVFATAASCLHALVIFRLIPFAWSCVDQAEVTSIINEWYAMKHYFWIAVSICWTYFGWAQLKKKSVWHYKTNILHVIPCSTEVMKLHDCMHSTSQWSLWSHLLVSKSQMTDLQWGGDVVGGAVKGGVVGVTHGVPGTTQSPAESEQLSNWPFGERQSLGLELSQVPGKWDAGWWIQLQQWPLWCGCEVHFLTQYTLTVLQLQQFETGC